MQTDAHPLKAAFWMTGAVASFTAMAVAGRQVSAVHDSFEIMTARSLVGFILVIAISALRGQLHQINANKLPGHFIRNIVHFTGQNLWFWALTVIPLAQVFALEFTSPIWVILLSPIFLGETLTRRKLVAAALGFAGVLIVAQPDFGHVEPGVLAAAAAAFFFASTNLMTKALTKGEPILSILFWLTLMQAVFGTVAMSLFGTITLPTLATLPWLVLIGISGITAHFSLTKALSLAPASTVVPVDFARLPIIAVVGALFYAEPIQPSLFAGAALIFLGIWITLRGGASAPQGRSVTEP